MKRGKVAVWHENGYDLMADAHQPYYVIGYHSEPEILREPITLATGDTLEPGSDLAYLGGNKTSAGFDNLHPIAPFTFRYVGMFIDGDNTYILWECGMSFGDEFAAVYYGHSALFDDGIVESLFYTNRAGSGRIIEAKTFYASHGDIPRSLYPLPYQKEMGWVA